MSYVLQFLVQYVGAVRTVLVTDAGPTEIMSSQSSTLAAPFLGIVLYHGLGVLDRH